MSILNFDFNNASQEEIINALKDSMFVVRCINNVYDDDDVAWMNTFIFECNEDSSDKELLENNVEEAYHLAVRSAIECLKAKEKKEISDDELDDLVYDFTSEEFIKNSMEEETPNYTIPKDINSSKEELLLLSNDGNIKKAREIFINHSLKKDKSTLLELFKNVVDSKIQKYAFEQNMDKKIEDVLRKYVFELAKRVVDMEEFNNKSIEFSDF